MHGIMEFFKLSNELHVDFAQLRPFTNEYSDPSLYISEGKRRYPNLNITSSSHKFSHMKDNNKQPYDICHGMYFNTVITADFKMWSCIHHRQNIDYYLGNLSNTTIKEILKSSHMKHIQNKVPNKDCPLFCRNDAINRTLNSICKNVVHKEFL
jgi:sulfatase maturation enzyme AslB (radical SAM superfamily)